MSRGFTATIIAGVQLQGGPKTWHFSLCFCPYFPRECKDAFKVWREI